LFDQRVDVGVHLTPLVLVALDLGGEDELVDLLVDVAVAAPGSGAVDRIERENQPSGSMR